ncbi:MAG: (Fe-S)-binding protein, partial [Nitrososphaerales archaeon]|nr:(Fe-S)-binding protein [Nitrososphaerales archaeon]
MVIALLGGGIRVWTWISSSSGREDLKIIVSIIKSVSSIIFSRKVLYIIKGLLLGIFTKAKLRSSDVLSGSFKVIFIIAYLSLIVAYHIKVEHIPQLKGTPSYILFFIAPFADFYFLSTASIESFTFIDSLYGFTSNLVALIVISYVLFMLYKRVAGKIHSKVSIDDSFCYAVILLWFTSKLIAEASTIIAFNVDPSITKYWFVSHSLSTLLKPLPISWLTLHYVLWPLSGLSLGILIASIPFTKLWHIITGSIQILRRYSFVVEPFGFGKKISTPFDLRKLLETGSFEVKIGIKSIKDMNWRQRMNVEPCVRCGRCQDACPAYAAGRDLSPMEVVLNLKSSLKLIFISDFLNSTKVLLSPLSKWGNVKKFISNLSERSERILLLDGILRDETVWSCT